jgi:nicotinate-nucleotide adenylyltransferase
MNVALFGGTFDPVHLGHLAVARAAAERLALDRVYFLPAHLPPHKPAQPVAAFGHRYAMVALATAGERSFVPSLLESPEHSPAHGANYSVDTVRRFQRTLRKSDRAFFLIGIDAFLEIAHWRRPETLLRAVEFIIVSRPGYSLAAVEAALPASLRRSHAYGPAAAEGGAASTPSEHGAGGQLVLPGLKLHLLGGVAEKVSATQIRSAAAHGRPLDKFVGPAVADYIRKQGLYREP